MSLVELLPAVRGLSRRDKCQLIQVLAADLAEGDASSPIEAGRTYTLPSPDRAYEAAAELLRVLES